MPYLCKNLKLSQIRNKLLYKGINIAILSFIWWIMGKNIYYLWSLLQMIRDTHMWNMHTCVSWPFSKRAVLLFVIFLSFPIFHSSHISPLFSLHLYLSVFSILFYIQNVLTNLMKILTILLTILVILMAILIFLNIPKIICKSIVTVLITILTILDCTIWKWRQKSSFCLVFFLFASTKLLISQLI